MKEKNIPSNSEQEISLEQFKSIDLRCGTILRAELLKNARKPAFVLEIDFGPLGIRKSSAQITRRYKPETLIGQQVIAVFNLPPRQIAGIRSQCLVLGLECAEGDVVLLQPQAKVPDGIQVS